jgi:hypothetical protein
MIVSARSKNAVTTGTGPAESPLSGVVEVDGDRVIGDVDGDDSVRPMALFGRRP